MHPEISKEDVKSFTERYKGSKEEAEDLLEFFEENEGDMTNILQYIISSTNDEIPRYIKFYEAKIEEGLLEPSKVFDKTKDKVERLPDEVAEAKKEKQKRKQKMQNKENSVADLEKMILAKRNNAGGGFLNYLEKKYGADEEPDLGKPAPKKRKLATDDKGPKGKKLSRK